MKTLVFVSPMPHAESMQGDITGHNQSQNFQLMRSKEHLGFYVLGVQSTAQGITIPMHSRVPIKISIYIGVQTASGSLLKKEMEERTKQPAQNQAPPTP